MSNRNSPEHRTITQCTSDLATAVKDDLTWLSKELVAKKLITDNNAESLRIKSSIKADRAAELVDYVSNRVSLSTDNYHSFVGVLESKEDYYQNILKKLAKTFRDLGESDLIPVSLVLIIIN